MLLLIWFEIKKYLLAYRRVLFGLLAAGIICAVTGAGASVITERQSLFEPFSVGVVDNGDSPEIRFVFDFFNDTIQLEYMDKTDAERRLAAGDIPAYVELPGRFAADIMSGSNTPFILHGNGDYPLQLALTRLLASGGVAFLSASQAGIYATIDQAQKLGMPWEDIQRLVVIPINVAFVDKMLEYDSFFTAEILPLTEGTPWTHYVYTFAAFLMILNLLSFIKTMRGYTPAVYARYRLAGIGFAPVQLIRLAGPVAVHLPLTVPLYFFATGNLLSALAGGAALAFCVSGFGLMTAGMFKNEIAAGMFVFLVAMAMVFVSGGIVPLAYLPRGLHVLRYAGIPYWAAAVGHGNFSGIWALAVMGFIFSGIGLARPIKLSR